MIFWSHCLLVKMFQPLMFHVTSLPSFVLSLLCYTDYVFYILVPPYSDAVLEVTLAPTKHLLRTFLLPISAKEKTVFIGYLSFKS